jgi:hypothetical protein
MSVNPYETTISLDGLAKVQGGDYHLSPSNNTYPSTSSTYMSAARTPTNYIPFVISLYKIDTDEALYPLNLMVNPNDIQYGHGKVVQGSYTRKGWVSSYWGSQMRTLTVSGNSAGFYYNPNQVMSTVDGLKIKSGGLTNYSRRNSIAFANLLALISYYKRNGAFFLKDTAEQTYWRDGTSRVIHVMDMVMVSYDQTDFIGSFNTFTLNDTAANPYRIEYNFEFIVGGIRGDKVEGHIHMADNDSNPKVEISLQGDDMELTKTTRMDEEELNQYFMMPNIPPSGISATYSDQEALDEESLNPPPPASQSLQKQLSKWPPNSFVITAGGGANNDHGSDRPEKADFVTSSGQIRSFSDGVVTQVVKSPGVYGGFNYITVSTQTEYNGEIIPVYVRYFHVDPETMADLQPGDEIHVGDYLGNLGNDAGKYDYHCDFAVVDARVPFVSWSDAKFIDCTDFINDGVEKLHEMSATDPELSDYQNTIYKYGKKKTAADGA